MNILAHLVGGDIVATVHAVLVTVDSADFHRFPVEAQLAIEDVEVTESYFFCDAFGLVTSRIEEANGEVVEFGDAVAPRLDAGVAQLETSKPVVVFQRVTEESATEGYLHAATADFAAKVNDDVKQSCGPVVGVEVGDDFDVGDVGLGDRVELHIACDATHAPHILAFEVAAVAPAQHLYLEAIPAFVEVFGDVPFGRSLRVFAIAYLATVDVEIHGRFYGTEFDDGASFVPGSGEGEVSRIDTHGVVVGRDVGRVCLWHVGSLTVADGELVFHIDIHGDTEALQFNVSRYADAVPM